MDASVRARAAEALGATADDRAVPALTQALASAPAVVQIAAARALTAIGVDTADEVIADRLLAIAENDDDVEIRARAAQDLLDIPGGVQRLLGRFRGALETERYHEALERLRAVEALLPDNLDVAWRGALALQAAGRLPEALAAVQNIVRRADFTPALLLEVEILFALDRTGEGLAAIEEAARQHPDDAGIQANHGWWLYVAGRLDESIVASSRAVELDGEDAVAGFNLGLARLAAGDAGAGAAYELAAKVTVGLEPASATVVLRGAVADLEDLLSSRADKSAQAAPIRELLSRTQRALEGRHRQAGQS